MKLITISLALAIALCAALLVMRGSPAPAAAPARDRERCESDAAFVELTAQRSVIEGSAPLRASLATAAEVAPTLLDTDELARQLRRIAAVEQALVERGGATPALQHELEEALRPLLAEPANLDRVLEHLVAGTWHEADEAGRLTTTEYGALRALYWGLACFHAEALDAPYGEPAAAAALMRGVLAALPALPHENVRELLIVMLLDARAGDTLLLARYVGDIVAMRALFQGQQRLFSRLLEGLGDALTPAQRDGFFTVFLGEANDPVLIGTTLRNLLRGGSPTLAMSVAGSLFDAPGASDELRQSVAQAVADGCVDPHEAAAFLAQRPELTRNMALVYRTLGAKEGGFVALYSEYASLAAVGASAKAREMLVMGMSGERTDLALVERIAFDDSDPRVRGQAFVSLSASDTWGPTERSISDLRAALVSGIPPLHARASAANIARKASAGGNPAILQQALGFLRDMASDASLSSRARRDAARSLTPYISEADSLVLLHSIPPD